MRRVIFIISLILHLLLFYWAGTVKFPLKIFDDEFGTVEPVTRVRLVLPGEVPLPPPPPASGEHLRNANIDETTTIVAPSREGVSQAGEEDSGMTGDGELRIFSAPKLSAPDPDSLPASPDVPDLSIRSQAVQQVLKDYDRQMVRSGFAGVTGKRTGGRGMLVFDNVREVNLEPWAKRALISIQRNWKIPLVTKKPVDNSSGLVTVAVVIEKNGRISALTIRTSSDVDEFDIAAETALRLSSPLPQLPMDYPGDNLEAALTFNYNLRQ